MNRVITVAIAGFGDRGKTYAGMEKLFPNKMKVVAVADIDKSKVKMAQSLYGIPPENAFLSAEEMLQSKRLADIVCICTMDRSHVDHAVLAIKAGYDILLEKPISPDIEQCKRLLELAEKSNSKIILCHVLRYTLFYNKIREIIRRGDIGEIVSVTASENVGYWHQAHSFVRGNWRNSEETSPMILQKSCHDMDILLWVTGKTCQSVSSIGSTYLFRREKEPVGAADYCLSGCAAKDKCVFDAEKIYITNERTGIKWGEHWPCTVLNINPTVEGIYGSLREGQYGRCVYRCDNNVVDNQIVNMQMTDGSTISFSMCAFTEDCFRTFKAMGTNGEIVADTLTNTIKLTSFGNPSTEIQVNLLYEDLKGHGGGDSGIMRDFLDLLINDGEVNDRTTTLEASMESHKVALAAEKSRLEGGIWINMK